MGIAILSGILTGFLVSNCCPTENFFDDEAHFHDVAFDIPLEELDQDLDDKKGEGEIFEAGEDKNI